MDTKQRYQLFIIDLVDGKELAVHIGGCKSSQQATVLFNEAYANKTVTKPQRVLLVPSANIFQCKAIQSFQLEALVEPAPQAQADAPVTGQS